MKVLVQFEDPVQGDDGRSYIARVCGREAAENIWDGWIEFGPGNGGPALRTPRETTQPNHYPHRLADEGSIDLSALDRAGLTKVIIAAVGA